MDKNEILARSRVENANGDEREQSLTRKSRAFGTHSISIVYIVALVITLIWKDSLNKHFFASLAFCFLFVECVISATHWYYFRRKRDFLKGVCGGIFLLLLQWVIAPMLP